MLLSPEDWSAIGLTLQLALVTTVILLVMGTPIAWWLATTRSRLKVLIGSVVALPLVLPPTVLGFYLLVFLSPQSTLGQWMQSIGLNTLPFTFAGMVVASVIYSAPFVIQPLQNAFETVNRHYLEVAATLGASKQRTFWQIVLPLSRHGILTACVLGFAHTVGEFGVVLMIGGNIPDRTRVVSMQIYNHVEALEYEQAHTLALGMVIFAFVVLVMMYWLNQYTAPRKKY
ncbi:MAG: molybdate ABC transporter permease subunit [Thiofilum sp.]|uniref:molybdate ABC transporter permease subunit n=1 Tax=Thiofilum sp. TaxID=2212733 RepID=UPI0025CBB62B|nr:molybdate ABC transporter permease subunit [Thiofilum sp.]MBK8453818.1 molybdate ABC transporter permease subunit [Thiofilum sp.]